MKRVPYPRFSNIRVNPRGFDKSDARPKLGFRLNLKRYTYAIDHDVKFYRQLEHKLNCFGKQHYQAQALNFQLSFKKTHHPGGCKNVPICNLP
ncbi:hypothetical protein OUZ56_011661 [Daphnia magna]|uniref:Uncharacterized protein n=1 Tax=Daphnia magna TaxID=35525 RepID=A0ABQ9Z0T5_9CRUS|nr:hypothetical protein OUZ56_011661 [Daphnia magna]